MNYVEPTGDEMRQQVFDRPPLMRPMLDLMTCPWSDFGSPVMKPMLDLDALAHLLARAPPAPMIDWEKLAGSYAAALAEANTKVRLLEDEVARLTPPASHETTTSDVLANCMRADRTLDAYGR